MENFKKEKPVPREEPKKKDTKMVKEKSQEDLSMNSQQKTQQTQKRQWKAPAETNDDYTQQPARISNFNQKVGNFEEKKASPAPPSAKAPEQERSDSQTKNKGLFGKKKNVFNPFAKKDSPVGAQSKPTETSFTNAADKSKVSSDFSKQIEPVGLDDTKEQPKKIVVEKRNSGEGSDNLVSDNYEDDDFDIGESLPKGEGDDIFNQNKNFTGGLAVLTKKDTEKESEPSGLGFDEHD